MYTDFATAGFLYKRAENTAVGHNKIDLPVLHFLAPSQKNTREYRERAACPSVPGQNPFALLMRLDAYLIGLWCLRGKDHVS